MTRPHRISRLRAPELTGRGWLNTGDTALTLAGLRGKIVILDFWAFCCVNCLHVIDEMRALEKKYGDVLVVVGIHSPKFVHEADPEALRAAVDRYEVHHPVLDDPELATWSRYAVRAWPTLAVVDPEGYIVAQMSGEGHAHALDVLIAELVAEHAAKGTLHRGDGPYVPPPVVPSTLRFPAKAARLPDGNVLVADAGHHRLTELGPDLETFVRSIGSGEPDLVDGGADKAAFNEPNGLCLLPDDIRAIVGYDVVVADTVNHALRGVNVQTGAVTTVAGTGKQWMRGNDTTHLSSPWDAAWHAGAVVVAMAGIHQLWSFDPITRTSAVIAGTTSEGLLDGDAERAWLAQPSGLASAVDPETGTETLWFVDSETSSLRRLSNRVVNTDVGHGLFEFGLMDGPADEALLQHPLGVTELTDGSIAVCDTYNGAVRRYDPTRREVTTLATDLAEPSGAFVDGDDLVVVESNAHRLTRLRLPENALRMSASRYRTKRDPLEVRAGDFAITVGFTPPTGQKLDERYGPATHLVVSSSPVSLLAAGAGPGPELSRQVVLADTVKEGVLHVSVRAASCDDDSVANPACHVHQQDWGVPIRVSDAGEASLTLLLSG